MYPSIFERTCVLCEKIFEQDALETLKCICPDCRKGKTKKPETVDEHIEEIKNPEFQEAFEKEEEKLEKESGVKKDNGTDNRDNGESRKGI